MRRTLLKTFAWVAVGGWLAAGPIDLSHGQGGGSGGGGSSAGGASAGGARSAGASVGGAAGASGAQLGGASGAASTGAGIGAAGRTGAAGAFSGQAPGVNSGTAANANQRAQGINAAGQARMRASAQGTNNRTGANSRSAAANAQNQRSETRATAGASRTGGAQASSVDNDRQNNPFDSRSNGRFDNRSGESGLFDDDSTDRTSRARSVREGQRPTTQPGLSRAQDRLDANQRRFEDRNGRTNSGLDTAQDRVQSNLRRFDDRPNTFPNQRFDDFENSELSTGGARSNTQRSNRPLMERRARFDAGAEEDELGTGMPDDPRIPDGDDRRRVLNDRLLDEVDRRARINAGVTEDELGTGLSDDPRLLNRVDRLPRELDDRLLDYRTVRDPASIQLDGTRTRLEATRDRLRTPADAAAPGLNTSADPRLEQPSRRFVDDPAVRTRVSSGADLRSGRVDNPVGAAERLQFRDDLDVRRNLSTRRDAGFRGPGRTPEQVDINSDGVDDRTIQGRRMLSGWLDSAARGLDSLNDRLNARPQTISVE